MSNEGGIDRSDVERIVRNYVAPIQRNVENIENELHSSIHSLDSKIDNVENYLRQQIEYLKADIYQKIKVLKDDIMTLSNNLERLINNLNSQMKSFEQAFQNGKNSIVETIESVSTNVAKLEAESKKNTDQVVKKLDETERETRKGLDNLSEGVQVVAKETKSGSEEISRHIVKGTQSTNEGLQKVSSGVTLQEFLEGQFMVSEAGLAIKNVKQQIESRYDQAQKNVEKIQSLYDDHFQRTINGFIGDLDIISSHIRKLEEKAFKNLAQISFDFQKDRDSFDRVVSAEQKRIDQRSQVIQSEYENLDLNALARFKELYNKMVQFIQEVSYLQFAFTSESESYGVTGNGFYLPVIMVQTEEDQATDIYCLNAGSSDCGQPVSAQTNLTKYVNELRHFCIKMRPAAGQEISQNIQSELGLAMKSLKDRGLIQESDYLLIEEHMSTHSLRQLVFENAS